MYQIKFIPNLSSALASSANLPPSLILVNLDALNRVSIGLSSSNSYGFLHNIVLSIPVISSKAFLLDSVIPMYVIYGLSFGNPNFSVGFL